MSYNNNKPKKPKNNIYTRNLEPLKPGIFFSNLQLFTTHDEEFDLHDVKKLKVYITIPTFKNSFFPKEIAKIDAQSEIFENVEFFVISNEPTYTQYRLSKTYKFKKFKVLSDFKNREFARATGTYIYELSQLVKAVFIVSDNDKLLYAKYYDDLYSNIILEQLFKEIKMHEERM